MVIIYYSLSIVYVPNAKYGNNEFTGQSSNINNGARYEHVDKTFSSVKYNPSSEKVMINGIDEDNGNYHETVLYHSTGPKTSTLEKPHISDNSEHIYEDDSLYHELGGADVPGAMHPLYEDPTLSQVCFVFTLCACINPLYMAMR